MTIGAGVSRWTMLHLSSAVVAFIVAQVLLTWSYADPIEGLSAPETLICVHIITVGWLSLLMLGALYQFIPVITNSMLFSQHLPIFGYGAILVGLFGMVAGFSAFGGNDFLSLTCLPVGGGLVLIGLITGALNIGLTLWRARPIPMQAFFVAVGLGFLLLTGIAGLTFTLALTLKTPPPFLTQFLQHGLIAHVAAGLVGWFTLTAMGVSYRLLSMFMLAPEDANRTTYAALILTPIGLLVVIAAATFLGDKVLGNKLGTIGAGIAALGLAFYLIDIAHLYRVRKRRHLELNSLAAVAALACLALAILATTVAVVTGTQGKFAGALAYLFIFGWLSGLGLSQLYKIVPFMTWLEVFGKRLGNGPVPRVQDLVFELRARGWFVLYFGSVVAATLSIATAAKMTFAIASYVELVATVLIGLELWQSRHPDPEMISRPLGAARSVPTAKS